MPSKTKPFLAQFAREDLPEQPEAGRYDEAQQISVTADEAVPMLSTDTGKQTMSSVPGERSAATDGGDSETDFTDDGGSLP